MISGVIRIVLEGTAIYIIMDPSIGLSKPVLLEMGRHGNVKCDIFFF